MPEYTNHKPGHPLYVSPSVRICGECGQHKILQQFDSVQNPRGHCLRTICRQCERETEQEKAITRATKAFADAATAFTRPKFAGSDGAPASRKSLAATLNALWQLGHKEGETDGEQVYGRMFAEFAHAKWTDQNPKTDFLKLKLFVALQRQMGELLRHDQPQIDLSHISPDELRELLTPFMLEWFENNPDQFDKFLNDMPKGTLVAPQAASVAAVNGTADDDED